MPDLPFRPICESDVVDLWRQRVQSGTALLDSNGKSLTVVYPGRRNDGRGGDFRDAVITSAEGPQKGCIEIHTLTSGWQSHGHHLDPNYNQVVLQVAWKADRGIPARAASGRIIPTVLLEDGQPRSPADLPVSGLACREYLARNDPGILVKFVDWAGEQRFLQKSRSFQDEMIVVLPEQILYAGLSRALGYSHNQSAFADFCERLPLSVCFQDLGRSAISDSVQIQAYLLGQAGLLPSQRGLVIQADGYVQSLEKTWRESGWTALSPGPAWEFYKVRPGNHPIRRLMALGRWLQQDLFRRWTTKFLNPIRDKPTRECLSTLNSNLQVGEGLYWSQHFDFGSSAVLTGCALIGMERAKEMIVNVILPFLLAWAKLNGERHLAEQILLIYRAHPALAVNSIQRHMSEQLGLPSGALKSACYQQGLLHIYKTLCTQGLCRACRLAGCLRD
jgi:hypothetical protein